MRDLIAIEEYMRSAMHGFVLSAFLFYVLVLFSICAAIFGILGFAFLFRILGESLKIRQREQVTEAEPLSTSHAA